MADNLEDVAKQLKGLGQALPALVNTVVAKLEEATDVDPVEKEKMLEKMRNVRDAQMPNTMGGIDDIIASINSKL